MTAARLAIGNYYYQKTSDYILNKFKWMSVYIMILCSSINLTYMSLKFNIISCMRMPYVPEFVIPSKLLMLINQPMAETRKPTSRDC